MTRDRWNTIKALAPRARLFWDSATKGTLDIGQNAAKRARREAEREDRRAAVKARRA